MRADRQDSRPSRWMQQSSETFYRVAASGALPARWFGPPLPAAETLPARTGHLKVELVTHCWNYAHLLAYQLSSIAEFPPTKLDLTCTVFYSEEDGGTASLLRQYEQLVVPGVRWNWQALKTPELFRRAIGRNRAALATEADWIWYTDCDVFFTAGCLDSLAVALQGRRDPLLYPSQERTTSLLLEDDPLLRGGTQPLIASVDPSHFTVNRIEAAKGAWQITHGDVARAAGYCRSIPLYQKPRTHWSKTYEDRTYRWLLGTQGAPIDVSGIYRIRHAEKGRYSHNSKLTASARGGLRRFTSWLHELRRKDS